MQCHDVWNALYNDVLNKMNEIMLYAFVLSMSWRMDVMFGHVSYAAVTLLDLGKINPWLLLGAWSVSLHILKCWWVDELLFVREINSVVRETPCIACEILLGNPEKLGDFYRGVINWKFCSAGDVRELDIIKLHTVGDFME